MFLIKVESRRHCSRFDLAYTNQRGYERKSRNAIFIGTDGGEKDMMSQLGEEREKRTQRKDSSH